MNNQNFFSVLLTIVVVFLCSNITIFAEINPSSVTTSDPMIPTEELELLLTPLDKDELIIEADAWKQILKNKAQEIAHVEIMILRENKTIQQLKELENTANEIATPDETTPDVESQQTDPVSVDPAMLHSEMEEIEQAEVREKSEKIDLLETVTQLREERTQLLDNLRAVVNELETKTDQKDTDIQATV
jgi:small conductance mechanosensitive channel